MAAQLSGELRTWHKTTLDCAADATFTESTSTFRDHRLDVTFTHKATGAKITVPGYFAADGDAADTGATSGKIWRVNFNAPLEGEWTYEASFRTGKDIAASTSASAGRTGSSIDGESGSFRIAETDKSGEDFRAKGMILQDDGTHYLQHQGDGDYFVRGGPGVPENFLASPDIDNTPTGRHDYSSHSGDYDNGDPTWDGGKGENIIGAVNYLAEQGQNSVYVMLLTAAGDGKDIWPWAATDLHELSSNKKNLDPNITSVYDVSKLAQWEAIFDHMDEKGIYKNVFFQEIENNQMLDGGTSIEGTSLSAERMIYMREMIARFGHNNGIQWNLGEENTNTTQQRIDMSEWAKAVDPYDHAVVLHTRRGQYENDYDPLLGVEDFDGPSFLATAHNIREWMESFRDKSAEAGDPWVLSWDEDSTKVIDAYSNDPDSENEVALREGLWGTFTVGGSGFSWYVKGSTGHSYDQNMDTFDAFESVSSWTAAATKFFNTHIPFWEMSEHDELTLNGGDFVLADPGKVYTIYLPYGAAGDVRLNLSDYPDQSFDVFWYNPRTGGKLIADDDVEGGAVRQIGGAPSESSKDWVLLVRDGDPISGGDDDEDQPEPQPEPEPEPQPEPEPPVGDEVEIWLVDPATDLRVLQISDGQDIDPGLLAGGKYEIEAVVHPDLGAGSVRLTLGGTISTENVAPYVLFEESGGDYVGKSLPEGPQALTVEVFSGSNGSGSKLASLSTDFAFLPDDEQPAPQPEPSPEPEPEPEPEPGPDAIDAQNDSATTGEGEEVTINVLDNDEGDLWVESFAQGDYGSVSKSGGGRLIYTPKSGFEGTDTFIYTAIATDGSARDTATVTVKVGDGSKEPAPTPEPAPGTSTSYNVDAGGTGDEWFSGGSTYAINAGIAGTTEDALYQTERYGDFGYSVAVENGTYDVTLKFAEIYFDAAGERVFDVQAEGDLVLDDFDIWEATGGDNIAHDVVVPVTVSDGELNLDFVSIVNNAKISGIDIASASRPAPEPTPDTGGGASGGFKAPFDLSGASLEMADCFIFGFGTDGESAPLQESGNRIGVANAGSDTEVDYRKGLGSEMIGFDFGEDGADAIKLDLEKMNTVGGAVEAAIFRTYDAAGAELEQYLLTSNSPVTLNFGTSVRFASLESSPWITEGDLPGQEPDFSLQYIDVIA